MDREISLYRSGLLEPRWVLTDEARRRLAFNLRRLQDRDGWTQRDLAESIGTGQAKVSKWMNDNADETMTWAYLRDRLAAVLEVDPWELIAPVDGSAR